MLIPPAKAQNLNRMKIRNKYEDRPIRSHPAWIAGKWQFKIYSIVHPSNTPPSEAEWEGAKRLVERAIAPYQSAEEETGTGYIIYHKGFDSNYFVVSWWARENMLRMFPYASTLMNPGQFTLVRDGLNICVWDMLIHSHERDAWVKHVLSVPQDPDLKGYVDDKYAQ